MANNLLAYPLLKQEAGGTTANQAALNELQSHAPFLAMGMVVVLCRSDSRRAALSGHYPSFDLSRGRTNRISSSCSLFYLHGPSTLGEWVATEACPDLNLGRLSLQADRIAFGLHMTLNALFIIIRWSYSFVYCRYREFSSMINYDKMVGTNEF